MYKKGWLLDFLLTLSLTEIRQLGSDSEKTMLTVNMHNKAGVVAKSIIELPASDKYIARIKEGT